MQLFILFFLFTVGTANAQTTVSGQPFEWNYVHEDGLVSVRVDIRKNHYLYTEQTRVEVLDADGNPGQTVEAPASEPNNDPYLGLLQVYPGGSHCLWKLKPQGRPPFTIKIRYQGCKKASGDDQSMCYLPETRQFQIMPGANNGLPLTEGDGSAARSETRPSLDIKAVQPSQTTRDNGLFKVLRRGGIWVYLAAFFAGVLSTMTPCVLPMIPITMAVLGTGEQEKRGKAVIRSLSYVLGIMLTFTSVATVAAIGGGSLGADALGNPYVLAALTLFFAAMSLSMLGVFELQLPFFIRQKINHTGGKGILGPFLMGCASGLVAFPCTGPVLAALLSIVAINGNPIFGASLMAVYALGFSLLFFMAGTGLGKLKPGVYMERLKSLIGVLLLVMTVYCAAMLLPDFSNLLSVGGAMNRLLSLALILGGFMMGAVHSDMYNLSGIGKKIKILGALFISIGVVWNLSMADKTPDLISWGSEPGIAAGQALSTKKPILIDFTAAWCPECKKMELTTFRDSAVVQELNAKWILVKIDGTITTQSTEKLFSRYGIKGLPAIVILDSDEKHLTTLSGYQSAENLLAVLQRVAR